MPTYIVTFDRIGRNHDVPPATFEDVDDADEMARRVRERVRHFLISGCVVDVTVDLEKMTGNIYTGARPAGSFTITETARADHA